MDKDWKKYVRREASSHHMCEENRDALEAVQSKAEAIELYKKTIDWALEEGYPSLPVLRGCFKDCEMYGVFIDKTFRGEILNAQQVYVFHNCKGWIRVGLNADDAIIPMLYFANGCEMTVKSSDSFGLGTIVPLYIFGDNRISAESSEDIDCRTFKFDVK